MKFIVYLRGVNLVGGLLEPKEIEFLGSGNPLKNNIPLQWYVNVAPPKEKNKWWKRSKTPVMMITGLALYSNSTLINESKLDPIPIRVYKHDTFKIPVGDFKLTLQPSWGLTENQIHW